MQVVATTVIISNGNRVVLWRWDEQFNTSQGGVSYSTVGSVFGTKSPIENFPDDNKPGISYKAVLPLA